jgi:hypothetical protein
MIHGIWGHKRPRTSRQVLYVKRTNRMEWLSRFGFTHCRALLKICGLRLYGLWLKQVLVSMSCSSPVAKEHTIWPVPIQNLFWGSRLRDLLEFLHPRDRLVRTTLPTQDSGTLEKRACKLLSQTRGHSDSFVCLNGIHFSIISCILMLIFFSLYVLVWNWTEKRI